MLGNSPATLLSTFGFLRDSAPKCSAPPPAPAPARTVAALQAPLERSGNLPSTGPTMAIESKILGLDRIPRVRPRSHSSGSSSSGGSLDEAGLDAARSTRPARPPRPPRARKEAPWPTASSDLECQKHDSVPSSNSTAPVVRTETAEHSLAAGEVEPDLLRMMPPRAAAAPPRSATTDSPRFFDEILGATAPFLPHSLVGSSSKTVHGRGGSDVTPGTDVQGNSGLLWMSGSTIAASSSTHSIHPRGSGVVQALSVIVKEMLLLKYGLALDASDFTRKVWSHCRGESGSTLPSCAEVISQLNLRSHDLRFQILGSHHVIALHVEYRILPSFQHLQAEVRRMPGTARTLGMVVPLSLDALSAADEEGKTRAVAVFREDYGRPNMLVGRDSAPGANSPLNSFSAVNLLSALVLDPVVDKAFCRASGTEATDGGTEQQQTNLPNLREEYASLGVWLLPEEPCRNTAATVDVGHVAALPWQQVLDAAVAEGGGPTPTQQWMQRLRRVLEHPDAVGEALLALLQEVATWLDDGEQVADTVKQALAATGLQACLVRLVKHAVMKPVEVNGGLRRIDLAVALQASRIIGLSSKGFPNVAISFAEVGAVSVLCGLMQRWPGDDDVQLSAICALGTLSEEDSGIAANALSAGALQLVRSAVNVHTRNSELQRNGTRVLQQFSSAMAHGESNSLDQANPLGQEADCNTGPSRNGLAAALLEKRAAEASRTQPGLVSTAVGWLFSGSKGSPSARQGNSCEPATGPSNSARLAAPAPYSPTPGVPRLDIPVAGEVPSMDSSYRPPAATLVNEGGSSGGSRASRRRPHPAAPTIAATAHDDDESS